MVDNRGDSAVYWAARQGHQDVVQYLISQGVHVNQQNKVSQIVFVSHTIFVYSTYYALLTLRGSLVLVLLTSTGTICAHILAKLFPLAKTNFKIRKMPCAPTLDETTQTKDYTKLLIYFIFSNA